MSFDKEQLEKRAIDYVEREANAEVSSIEFMKEATTVFGPDIIFSAEITDNEEPECWVIGGSTPMNLYAKSQFHHPEEAHQFHFGTISQLMRREI